MNTTQPARELPGRHWISIAVVVGCVLVLVAILLPAVHRARQAAQRTQSKNNLKMLALAVHNYHDTYKLLPLGADVLPDGTAKHGWCTRIVPYLEASDLYSQINMNLPWDHPVQLNLFRRIPYGTLIPGVDQTFSTDGYSLLHYMANPNAMHRNHCVTFDDMTTGTANNWLLGEASRNYQPWGYPFNWRTLNTPLNSGPDGYGVWPDGGQFCLADGSVQFLSNATDTALLKSLANAPPIATSTQIAQPDHRKESPAIAMREVWFEADVEIMAKSRHGTLISYDRFNTPYCAELWRDEDTPAWNVDHTMQIDLAGILKNFPKIRILKVWAVNDEDANLIADFRDLEFLEATHFELTGKGEAVLEARPKLKMIAHR